MANNTLFGLAFLNFNWEANRKDILDTYIPLACDCIKTKGTNTISRDELKELLFQIYGLAVPSGVVESILKRCVGEKLLKKNEGVYFVDWTEINKLKVSKPNDLIEDNLQDIILKIKEYAKSQFGIDFEIQEIENGFIQFLEKFDADIILTTDKQLDNIKKVRDKNKLQYVISKFIIQCHEGKSVDFKKIANIAQGHAIATIVANSNIKTYVGLLTDVVVYLDAPLIFNLIGINGVSNFELAKELITSLIEKGASIKVFSINNEEVTSTINDAINRLNSKNFDIHKSSRVLRTAIRESYTSAKLQLKLNQIPDLYKKYNISVEDSPEINPRYQINEKKLIEVITGIYTNGGAKNLAWYQENQINRDAKTIANIFMLRGGTNISTLRQSKAILLTTNEAIAFSSRNYQISNYSNNSIIAPCITDVFLATILWANYPSKNDDINIKRLMSSCYSNIELDNKLFHKFYTDVEALHKEQTISDEQYYLLSSSNLTYKLLERKTLNDVDEYTDKTAGEIVEDIINSYKHGTEVVNKNIRRIAKYIAKIIFWIIWSLLIGLVFFIRLILPLISQDISNMWNWIISIIAGLLGAFGLFRWVGLIPDKSVITNFIIDKVETLLEKILKRE